MDARSQIAVGSRGWLGIGAARVGKATWIVVAGAVVVLFAVIVLIAHTWAAIGDVEMSTAGWVAIVFGVVVAVGLGIGLMSLVFISSREGFDESGSITRISAPSASPRSSAVLDAEATGPLPSNPTHL
jgi:hypothetical protein